MSRRLGTYTVPVVLAYVGGDFYAASTSSSMNYDEHDAKPYRWTYDGTPLKAA